MKKYLVMEDGTVLSGQGYGSYKEAYGELVFTTSMTGYLETLTDPSYVGQMLVFASPTIANYALEMGKMESNGVKVSALITKDAHIELKKGGYGREFDEFLKEQGIPGIDGIDTRMLVRKIRANGVLRSYVVNDPSHSLDFPDPMNDDLVSKAVPHHDPVFVKGEEGGTVLFIDLGSKNTLKELMLQNFSLIVVDKQTNLDEIEGYDAIFVSNGPGDPSHPSLSNVIKFLSHNIGVKPLFGICFGLQAISLAYGAKTYKMKFGHRGSNHAVTDGTHSYVTTHNHGYAVDGSTVKDFKVIGWDANDGTVEIIEGDDMFAVQFHPEASPGPHDTRWFFGEMKRRIGYA
ncbi:carbamoyl-phosphate synthase alpha subunit [Thermoplasma volcanium GSS1]|uniref:Carbamoyl phosphate synthase small chain n=1 Tax=Thermoplasma volcanium (strain ATCC 51530 / DSM 4299 / JCM 9571 / NBRC 15438 / GSS1) TaxID=273116 RepID=CARA_THEVO|nr:carbamoyl-phosphate synthase small subunit [Thermoplasma volcanium]Q97AJ4.1 RecName: Full=Carbamoyl phosphate synthase small chain; AltName: Full=Carbamoyl phosphate synthetase glutamine chain [Thermoplasma volcanium GSS1]BAB59958.1 carbamoyl-phosphate synthase alpha subunit [Thermoplasma volcanium GSS1]